MCPVSNAAAAELGGGLFVVGGGRRGDEHAGHGGGGDRGTAGVGHVADGVAPRFGRFGAGGEGVADERDVRQRRERAAGASQLGQRDVEKRSHHLGAEVGAGATGQLGPRVGERHRGFVGAHRGHHFERIGHRDDRGGTGDVVAGELAGVAGAVPSFVMSADGVDPFAEPVGHRRDEFLAAHRMVLQDRPFGVGGLALLVEDLRRHVILPMSWINAAHCSLWRSSSLRWSSSPSSSA